MLREGCRIRGDFLCTIHISIVYRGMGNTTPPFIIDHSITTCKWRARDVRWSNDLIVVAGPLCKRHRSACPCVLRSATLGISSATIPPTFNHYRCVLRLVVCGRMKSDCKHTVEFNFLNNPVAYSAYRQRWSLSSLSSLAYLAAHDGWYWRDKIID